MKIPKSLWLLIVIPIIFGCSVFPVPVSRSIFYESAKDINNLYDNRIALHIDFKDQEPILEKSPSGFANRGGRFQFDIYDILIGNLNDAFDILYRDVYYLKYIDDLKSLGQEHVDYLVLVVIRKINIQFAFSALSVRTDQVSVEYDANITVRKLSGQEKLFDRDFSISGKYAHNAPGGGVSAFERAFSRATSNLINGLTGDPEYEKLHVKSIVTKSSVDEKLETLERLRKENKITEEEYIDTRKKILNEFSK